MSQTEVIKGKFILVDKKGLTLEQLCEKKLKEELPVIPEKFSEYYATYEEALLDECYHKFFVYRNNLYEIIETEDLSEESFCKVSMTGLQVYEFTTSFYNGGTCLTEMLREGLEESGI